MEPNVLSRRIEQLAALAVEDIEGESATDLVAVLTAVRSDVAALRGDLGELRSELGSVRTDLDGLSGRLTGSVAASRTETGTLVRRVADLANRVETVGGRVEEVRTDLPSLSREVREALDLVPVRTGNRLDELSTEIAGLVGARVDAVSAEVRRSLLAAQEREAASVAAAQAGLDEARSSLESRMATLEDALDAMAENLEAVSRDGVRTTRDLLRTTAGSVAAIEASLATTAGEQVERVVARLRDVTKTSLDALAGQVAEALQQRGEQAKHELVDGLAAVTADGAAVRAQVAELSDQAHRDQALTQEVLGDLARAVAQALRGLTDDVHTELDDVAERMLVGLAATHRDVATHVVTQTDELQAVRGSVEARLEALRTHVSEGAASLRADVGAELAALRPEVAALSVELAASARAQGQTRGELEGLVTEVRGQLRASTAATDDAVRTALSQQSSRAAELAAAGLVALQQQAEEHRESLERRLAELVDAITEGTAAIRGSGERADAAAEGQAVLGRAVAALQGEWPGRLEEAGQAVRTAGETALATVTAEVRARLDPVLADVQRLTAGLDQARAALEQGTQAARAEAAQASEQVPQQAKAALARVSRAEAAAPSAKAGPAKAGPTKAGPPKAAAGKAGTNKAGPNKAGTNKAGTNKAGTAKVGTAKVAPVQEATAAPATAAAGTPPRTAAQTARRGRLDTMPEVPSPTVALAAATADGPVPPSPGEVAVQVPRDKAGSPDAAEAEGRRRFGRRRT